MTPLPSRPRHSLHRVVLASCAALALALACHPREGEAPARPTDAAPTTDGVGVDIAGVLAASDLPPAQPQALADDPMGVTVHRLKNGMTVYISTDRREPKFSAWIAVRTGSRNDPANSTGLAHYLEHMLFKGTDELGTTNIEAERPHLEKIASLYDRLREVDDPAARSKIFAQIDSETQATVQWAIPDEMTRIYGSLGIDGFNAFTNDDTTTYIANVPSNRLEAWAEVEIERFRDATFRLFYPELESVYEEKNLSLDDPWDQLDEATRLALFPHHPYGTQPTIGLIEHLKTPAYGDMVAYMERWYVPNNMAIILAGDIDAATALPVLERTLGTLPAKPLAKPAAGDLRPVRGRISGEVLAEGEESVSIAWRTVSETDPDEPTLTVLDSLVDNSTNGLLNVELELTQKVPDASSSPTHLREAGYWTVSATAREGQSLEEVEQLLLGVVAKLKAGQIEQETLDAVLLNQDISDKKRLESNGARAYEILGTYITRRTPAQRLEREARLRKVSKADVIAAANRYLGDDRVVLYRRRGKPERPMIDKPTITPLVIDGSRESAFGRKIAAMPAKLLEPEWLVEGTHYERGALPSGPLVVAHNDRNDLFQVMIVIERGQRKERLLCHALHLLELSGSADKSAQALRDELYALGSSVELQCDDNATVIFMDGLDRNMDASLKLLEGWLRGASFDASTLSSLNDNTLSARKDLLEDPDAVDRLLRAHAFYGERSPFKVEPSNRELRAAKPKALAELVHHLLDYRRNTYYFGPRSAKEATAALTLRGGKRDPGPFPKTEYRRVDEPTIYFVHKDVAKSTIHLAIPQGALPPARRPEALVLEEYLDGASSLLFLEIREARGLAYYSSGFQSTGGRPGDEWAFIGSMGTQTDKTSEALATYLEVVRRPIAQARLTSAKKAMEQRYRSSRVDPRWVMYRVRGWDLRGETRDPRPQEWKSSAAIDIAGLQPLAETLKSKPPIFAIVGDRKRIDLEALKKLGTVIELEASELTSFGAFGRAKPAN